ncbi:DUF302 domain-containing protein [Sphingosinicella rhizophila]|uniref:DUF302 domain-containing protein n=1 Tax=Sphingosinicella rhizophila TaxID=3050082 RepID=A0ABU3Q6I9_9SPHN|nr:DUF302 domain-containing protein [Sphingosinicella sp. GR2756]MDT9599010.1 DUF302 domain-containing protein [Sphingosinicella sp. GR2756]
MIYYFATTLAIPFEEGVRRTKAALQEEGFGVLSEIDVAATLKQKIGVEFRPYRILGACNPALAYQALQQEDKIGTMLPCNLVVQEQAPGSVEIAAIDPVASMQAVENPALGAVAATVRSKLAAVVKRLEAGNQDRP